MSTTIATLQEFAAAIPIDDIGRVDQVELQRVLDSAAKTCHRFTSRLFEPDPPLDDDGEDTAAAVTIHRPAMGRSRIKIPDVRSVVSVTLDGVALVAQSDYYLEMFSGYLGTSIKLVTVPSPFGAGDLAITGRFGMLECPEDIKDSVIELGAKKWRRRDARWSDQVQTGDGRFSYFSSLPQSVVDIWSLYRQPNVAVV